MPYLMRLNRDVDDFQIATNDDGDVQLCCPYPDCTSRRTYLFGLPDMGTLIGDAYKHLDDRHPDRAKG